MEEPKYLEIIEDRIFEPDTIPMEEPMMILIPVVDKDEAILLSDIWEQEFITRGVPYKTYYHFHTHNVSLKKNKPCVREDI